MIIPLALATGLLAQGAQLPPTKERALREYREKLAAKADRLRARELGVRVAESRRIAAILRSRLAAARIEKDATSTVDRMPIGRGERTIPMPTLRPSKSYPMPNGAPTRYLELYGNAARRKP